MSIYINSGEEITDFTEAEKKMAKQDKESSMILDLYGEHINKILDKYGLMIAEKRIFFKEDWCFMKFLDNAFNNTVIKDLDELGISVTTNLKHRGMIDGHNTMIDFNRAKFK